MARSSKFAPALIFARDAVGLGLGLSHDRVGGIGRGGNEDLAEADLLGLGKVVLVGVVVGLLLTLGRLQVAADFVADDLLGEDAVLDIGLEVLKGVRPAAGQPFPGLPWSPCGSACGSRRGGG